MNTITSKSRLDINDWQLKIFLLNQEQQEIENDARCKFPNFDFPISKGGCRLKKQLKELAREIENLATDVKNSSVSRTELSTPGLFSTNWIELYEEQSILQERYYQLQTFIQKFKLITLNIQGPTRIEALA